MELSNNSKRIATNTLFLYFRMIVIMLVGLYTSRVILNSLGISDYGIYTVVGGIVTMFTFLSTTLSTAISRFLTFHIGKNDKDKLSATFSSSLILLSVIAIILFVLAEVLGCYFVGSKLNIPEFRINAAYWVLHSAIIILIINLISIPYNSAIIAHEKMSAFAYISILEAVFRLLVAFALQLSSFDKLKTYAVLMVVVAIIVRFSYSLYCNHKFEECKVSLIFDKNIIKEMSGFASWNLIGTGAYLLNTQGINILSNIFFGVTVNAARGIADQVNNLVIQFVNNFTTSLNPQITKSYAKGDYNYLNQLVCNGARYSFFMILLLSVPFLFETEWLLKIWLNTYPDYSTIFVRLVLVCQMVDFLGNTTARAVWATGNVKSYYQTVSFVSLLVLPISYVCFKLWLNPILSYFVFILIYIILIPIRLTILKRVMPEFDRYNFYKSVIIPCVKVFALSIVLPLLLKFYINTSSINSIIFIIVSLISVGLTVYTIGLGTKERSFLIIEIKKRINKT